MQQLDDYYQHLSQHVSGIIMPIFRRTKTVLLHKFKVTLLIIDAILELRFYLRNNYRNEL